MANQEHLEILEQGVSAWNEWREKNLLILPELGLAPLEPFREGDVFVCDGASKLFYGWRLVQARRVRGNWV